ncbi:phage tail tape measure protein [Nonomuraea sp. NPDC050328]|uniref:phage tail tape measure protein n=1 Tax=Nonomuraea sp. NPDC050328 TaxID=3364361 RepID=UPI003790609B
MATLTVGELVAYAQIDRRDFQTGTRDIAAGLRTMQTETSSSMASMESSVTRSLSEIEQSIRDGLDPAAAIADLDQLERELDASFDEMLAEADAFASDLEREIDEAFDRLDDDARQAGRRAGEELVDGLEDGLAEADQVARDSGREAGREFGDGVEDGGGGAGGGGRMAGIGANLIGGLKAGALGLALAAGAAIGAKLMQGLEGALDAESAKQKLFAQLGTTKAESEKLGKVAGKLYADAYGESMGDVTEALKSVVQQLDGMQGASEESLGAMGARAMDTAKILDENVTGVTRAVAQMLRNRLAPDAEYAFDLLVRGAQEGANKSEDLLDTFNEYSTQFRELGLSGADALGLISQGLKAGARDADTIADAIKEFAIRAKDGSDTSAAAFKTLGYDADTMFQVFAKGGPAAKAALGDVLMRIREMKDPVEQDAVAVGLFGTKAEDLQDALLALDPASAAEALGKVKGAAKEAGDTLNDTATVKLEAWKRGIEQNVVEFLGGSVLPKLEEFGTVMSRGFELSGVAEEVRGWAADLGGIWDGIVADVKEWVAANGETLGEWKEKFQEGFDSVSTVVTDVLTSIKEFWDEWGDEILTGLGWVVDNFLNVWNAFWGTFSGLFKLFKGLLTGDFEEIKAGLSKIWDSIWRYFEDTIDGYGEKVSELFGQSWEDIKSRAADSWEGIKKTVSTKINDLVTFVKDIPTKIKTGLGDLGKLLVQAGKDLINGLVAGIKAKALEPVNAVKSLGANILGAFKAAVDSHSPSKATEEIGEWTIDGFINGLLNKGKELLDTTYNTVKEVITSAKKATGTGNGPGGGGHPSTAMHEIGKLTVEGLLKGLRAKDADVKQVIDGLIAQVKDAFKNKPDVQDWLLHFVRGGNLELEGLALKRQEIVQRIADANEAAKKIAGDAKSWASITGLTKEEMETGDFSGSLKNRAQQIKDFARNIQELARKGLNKTTLQQIINAGVEQGGSLAEMLVGQDGSEIKAINKAQKQIDNMSKQLGKAGADAMFDTGKKAGDGYLRGLQEGLKELDGMMEKIVKALVKAIKKELKIKSPSQVFAEIGMDTMAGLVVGIQAGSGSVLDAMSSAAGSLVGHAEQALTGGKGGRMVAGAGGGDPTQVLGGSSAFSGARLPAGPAGVQVDMTGSTITVREEADLPKVVTALGAEFSLRAPVLN